MGPNAESAQAAVETLQAELEMVERSLGGIDQKGALIPPVLGAIAALFIGPDTKLTLYEGLVLVVALVTGVLSVGLALYSVRTRRVSVGPDAKTAAGATHLAPAAYRTAVAGSLAIAIATNSEVAEWKGHRVNLALALAGATIFFLAVARIVRGL